MDIVDYHNKQLQVRNGIIAVLTVLLIALGGYCSFLRDSSASRGAPASLKIDTTRAPLPPAPQIAVVDSNPKVQIRMPKVIAKADTVVDSSLVLRLLAERDSLARQLAIANVSVTFSTDTIHPTTRDTLSIECDELNRRIRYSLAYAPREQTIITRTETYIKPLMWYEKLLYALGGFGLNEIIHFFRK